MKNKLQKYHPPYAPPAPRPGHPAPQNGHPLVPQYGAGQMMQPIDADLIEIPHQGYPVQYQGQPVYPQQHGQPMPGPQSHVHYHNDTYYYYIDASQYTDASEYTNQQVYGAAPGTTVESGGNGQQVQYGYNQHGQLVPIQQRLPPGQQQACQVQQKKASPILIAAVIVLAAAALYFFSKSLV